MAKRIAEREKRRQPAPAGWKPLPGDEVWWIPPQPTGRYKAHKIVQVVQIFGDIVRVRQSIGRASLGGGFSYRRQWDVLLSELRPMKGNS